MGPRAFRAGVRAAGFHVSLCSRSAACTTIRAAGQPVIIPTAGSAHRRRSTTVAGQAWGSAEGTAGLDDARRPHTVLVDGSGVIWRSFYGLPALSRADGTPTNAAFGFVTTLVGLLDELLPDNVAVVFDAGKSFRSALYPAYKANRPPTPDDLLPQFALARAAAEAFNVVGVELRGYEADDLIATYTRLATDAGHRVTVVSSDKDMMQLVGPRCTMYDVFKGAEIGPDEVVVKFGVRPERVIDVQALAGDSADNVPGVPGIGVKTAALLINEFGDLDAVLARAAEVKQPKRRERLLEHADHARISRTLVTLRTDVPVPVPLEALVSRAADPRAVLRFLRLQDFKSLVPRWELSETTPRP